MTQPNALARLNAEWMNKPASRAVISALEMARPASARFVGGCVRNTLMNRPVDDIDIATQLTPDETLSALETAGIRAIPTGIEHGTITAIIEGEPFEITSLRRDVETDGRRAVVAFTQDWREDAQRRDFRLNALYAAPDGEIFDPVDGGYEDALSGRVIFIGNGDERLREDYLRILRFFRFNAWYGAGIDPDGLAACTRQREGLSKIAAERIWKEFKKLLGAPSPSSALEAMRETEILTQILGQDWGGVQRTERLVEGERTYQLQTDPMRRLMTLIPGHAEGVNTLAKRLRLSNGERDRLLAWAQGNLEALGDAKAEAIRAGIYWHGAEAVLDRALVENARSGQKISQAFLDICGSWTPPKFPLGGEDALGAGLSGPAIGEALKRAENAWVASDFKLSRDELLTHLS